MDDLLVALADFLVIQLRGELLRQDHKFTGSLSKSIEYQIKQIPNAVKITYILNDYGLSLNDGIAPNRIPYTRGSGRKSSKYIDGLKKWVRGKFGYSQKRAESVAFAIANKQKQKGFPLTRKVGWIDITLETSKKEIETRVAEWAGVMIEDTIAQFIKANNNG